MNSLGDILIKSMSGSVKKSVGATFVSTTLQNRISTEPYRIVQYLSAYSQDFYLDWFLHELLLFVYFEEGDIHSFVVVLKDLSSFIIKLCL